MAEVVLPGNLVALFPGAPRRVALEAASVREVIAALDARIPGLADRLLDSGPSLRRAVRDTAPVSGGRAPLGGAGRHWRRRRGLVLVLTKGQYFAGRDL